MSQASKRRQNAERRRAPAAMPTMDSFQNLAARLGQGAGSLADGATYVNSNLITRLPRMLEFMYRGSWIVGAVVDSVADDMTREGVDFGSVVAPKQIESMLASQDDINLWGSLNDLMKWARLYGGAIGILLIDGQDPMTPLRVETISKDQFRGILPLCRWELMPVTTDVIQAYGSQVGMPEIYLVGPNATAMRMAEVHHSRVIRVEGIRLPFFQRVAEQGWGMSVIERMFDRLTAYDSATTGAAQLVYKAYLRTLKVEGLRQILAMGGQAEAALAKNVEAIRQFQSIEGMTLIDAKDDLDTQTYAFSGLNELLMGFGEQLSGATQIPLVRLFGQSPSGLNSNGDADIRNYYDAIKSRQERDLRSGINLVSDVLFRSSVGGNPPEGFRAEFNPCWQLSETEKAAIAKTVGDTVGAAVEDGIISIPTAMKELRQSADVTGIFSNISDEDIKEAEDNAQFAPPPGLGDPGELGGNPDAAPAPEIGQGRPLPRSNDNGPEQVANPKGRAILRRPAA